ncbi:MAG: adenosylcobinamide-GDP ribazoletransferase [Pseudolabrys sp.]
MYLPDPLERRLNEVRLSFVFLTRLPLLGSVPFGAGAGDVARALWAAPLVGAVVGALGAAAYAVPHAAGVPAFVAAVLAVAATTALTGALHEDGLADVADGFGGGATRERKLEIMHDSCIGTYGVCALILSFLLRIGSLATIEHGVSALAALVAAHAAGRAVLPAFMRLVPPARTDGVSAQAGTPPAVGALVAALLGAAALVGCLGPRAGGVAVAGIVCGFGLMAWLCRRQINGQTGDVLGAAEQLTEVIVLIVAAATLPVLIH